jgi:hypothetical protein
MLAMTGSAAHLLKIKTRMQLGIGMLSDRLVTG